MSSQIAALTPQMRHYTEELYEDGRLRWLPYTMYFHPAEHRSEIVNTDRFGFRYSHGPDGARAAVGDEDRPSGPVNLLVGSSMAFGVGATSDEATVASRLWSRYAPSRPWLSVAGRSFNSTQELVLFLLHRHLVPEIERIVVVSGFNNLGLARQPQSPNWNHGAFFQHNEFTEKLTADRPARKRDGLFGRRPGVPAMDTGNSPRPDAATQVTIGTDLTLRHLDGWRLLAKSLGAELSFALQPMATWVRDRPAPQEQLLFDELDEMFSFTEVFGDIIAPETGRSYSAALRSGCERLGVPFVDLNPLLGEAAAADDWLFTDRAHLTDLGYDTVTGLLADRLGLS
ncbi:SGNH/GDSL hydrolase family protein [Kitasatospora purpeofusca]|uniref:GDSL-type esterase/lipase family protein n=1 Tax=Kitasatospora purpeofusca TaxID=67352 RepID=A0ABZ1U8I1_9ACTN|nr:GDSL-type esterase/lipase family protein [Kitasatospora purpeofusca]